MEDNRVKNGYPINISQEDVIPTIETKETITETNEKIEEVEEIEKIEEGNETKEVNEVIEKKEKTIEQAVKNDKIHKKDIIQFTNIKIDNTLEILEKLMLIYQNNRGK